MASFSDPGCLSIHEVQRATGLSKETLRVWERRYGFPAPVRDATGERLYPQDQIMRLRLIKRLVEQGQRPGKLMRADEETLKFWLEELRPDADAQLAPFIAQLREQDAEGFHTGLSRELSRLGLQTFITAFAAPLAYEVGEHWATGTLDVRDEHLFAELMQNLLRTELLGMTASGDSPRILLSTLNHELHGLALLMAQAILADEGAFCVSLGLQSPIEELIAAARERDFDILALSFSAAYPAQLAHGHVAQLRALLPARAALWVGGAHLIPRAPALEGVIWLGELGELPGALRNWRAEHPPA